METEKVGDPSDMDAVMAYRNYLAAEDHLDELIHRATSSEEKRKLEAMLDETIHIRDNIMPKEHDPTRHCIVKHFSAGYEGVRERWKDKRTEELYYLKRQAYDLLIDALEMVWGRKIITCERCDYERTSSRDTGDATSDGITRGTIQAVSADREPSVQSVPTPIPNRGFLSEEYYNSVREEVGGHTHHNWDSDRKAS